MSVSRGSSTRALGGNTSLQIVGASIYSADWYSPAITLGRQHGTVSFELYSASADRAGSLYVQVSNSGNNWNNVTFDDGSTSATVTGSSAFNAFITISDVGARYVRLFFDRSAGTAGTLDVYSWTK